MCPTHCTHAGSFAAAALLATASSTATAQAEEVSGALCPVASFSKHSARTELVEEIDHELRKIWNIFC